VNSLNASSGTIRHRPKQANFSVDLEAGKICKPYHRDLSNRDSSSCDYLNCLTRSQLETGHTRRGTLLAVFNQLKGTKGDDLVWRKQGFEPSLSG
jgi:hypothetical protein